jgi:hypothetical protein
MVLRNPGVKIKKFGNLTAKQIIGYLKRDSRLKEGNSCWKLYCQL